MMRLSNVPPKGAGEVKRITKTDRLLQVIDGLGIDKKTFNPIGIRTQPLAEASGVPANSIGVLLAQHVASGRVCICKITIPGAASQNEYRKGAGVPPPNHKPLNARQAGAALGQPHHRTHGADARPGVALSTPALVAAEPAAPVVLSRTSPQPAVGNTGSAQPERRGMGPAPAKAPAGDVSITIDAAGVLVIGTDEGAFELQPNQCKRLGHFMVGSERIWNPLF